LDLFFEFVVSVISILIFGFIFLIIYEFPLFTQIMPCKAYKDNVLIYEGPAYNINADSKGATTQITITKGDLIRLPYKYYVSNNIRVVCE